MTVPRPRGARPRLAVFKLASCDGCQVAILNLESRLFELADRFDIVHFPEATSRIESGPYDVALVEGSVSTPGDVEGIREIRDASRTLVAIGACATSGGVQALRNVASADEFVRHVYPRPEWVRTLPTSTALSDHVAVDVEIPGCPVDGAQVLRVLTRALLGARPDLSAGSVCLECKRRGHACVVVTKGLPCMGPVTRAGCGALCPSVGRECYACFGPSDDPAPEALARGFEALGLTRHEIARRFRGICGWSPAFRRAADHLERPDE